MKRVLSIVALAIVFLMLLSLFSGIILGSVGASAASVDSMQKELEEIAKRKESLEKELNVIKEKKEQELEKKSIIDQQISETKSEIDILNDMISTLDDQLDAAEEQLDKAQQELEENLELSKARIRSAYEQGETSFLEIIAQAKSLHELITKVEIANQIAKRDNEVIASVKKNMEIIEQKRAEIKEKKETNEKAASQLESKKKQLVKKQDASEQLIDEMNSDAAATKRAYEKAEAAEKQLQNEIRAALQAAAKAAQQQNGGSGATVIDTGSFRWPLDAKYKNITSPFGYRVHPTTGVYKLHSGADISSSGIRGASVYAAKGGTVLKAGFNTAYGNYVLINHGDGYATLYGHCESLSVSVGQTVAKGDVIGHVGSTGYSTGPHLHFEIIKNGEYTNPLSYFSGVMTFTYS